MGMIQSIEIDRHQTDSSWTIDGYPNEVDIALNVTDLFSDLAMSSGSDPDLFINNDNLLAYLGTLCGIDYTAPNIALRQSLYLTTKTLAGQAEGASATVGRMVNQYISNLVDDARQYYSIG